ncbi:DUF4942 domain-containing protein [Spirosoma fluminis]
MLNNPDFYPTPEAVIHQMVEPHRAELKGLQILEPSAGSGAILDYLTTKWVDVPKKNLYAIESDPELTYTLQGKQYRVIENDFLTYSGDYSFDLILMNPPFSNGADHLLKAWEVLRSGHIVCLLNQETINNLFSRKRQLLTDIIEQHGSVKPLGPVFANAARRTNVNIALVRLEKKAPDPRFELDLDFVKEAEVDFSPEIAGNQVALNDVTGAMLRQYELTRLAMVEFIKARNALLFYGNAFLKSGKGNLNIGDSAHAACKEEKTSGAAYNRFISELNASAWRGIISKMEVEKIFTHGVYENLEKFRQSQGSMALTRENIISLVQLLIMNREGIMDSAIVDVFDTFTKYHKENRCHVEGWKTNSAWKVNRKVILPGFLDADHRWQDHYRIYYDKWRQFEDIDKVMCWLSGKDYDDMSRPVKDYDYRVREHEKEYKLKSLKRSIETIAVGDNSLHESEFFLIRCFKKGTLHITFKEEFLWATFNQRACKGKNWLPK